MSSRRVSPPKVPDPLIKPKVCGYCGTREHRATAFTANGRDLEAYDRWHCKAAHDEPGELTAQGYGACDGGQIP